MYSIVCLKGREGMGMLLQVEKAGQPPVGDIKAETQEGAGPLGLSSVLGGSSGYWWRAGWAGVQVRKQWDQLG